MRLHDAILVIDRLYSPERTGPRLHPAGSGVRRLQEWLRRDRAGIRGNGPLTIYQISAPRGLQFRVRTVGVLPLGAHWQGVHVCLFNIRTAKAWTPTTKSQNDRCALASGLSRFRHREVGGDDSRRRDDRQSHRRDRRKP